MTPLRGAALDFRAFHGLFFLTAINSNLKKARIK